MLRLVARAARCASRRGFAALAFSPEAPLRVCVVGSGPAGFYTADRVRGAQRATRELHARITRRDTRGAVLPVRPAGYIPARGLAPRSKQASRRCVAPASQLLHRYGDSVRVDILVRRPATRHTRLADEEELTPTSFSCSGALACALRPGALRRGSRPRRHQGCVSQVRAAGGRLARGAAVRRGGGAPRFTNVAAQPLPRRRAGARRAGGAAAGRAGRGPPGLLARPRLRGVVQRPPRRRTRLR